MFGDQKGEVIHCKCGRWHDIRRGTKCICACGEEVISKEYKADHIKKSNHIIGCELESYVNILSLRGFDKESDLLRGIASRIK